MPKPLSKNDLDFILFSLRETRKKFASFEDAPSADHRQNRLGEIDRLIAKVQAAREELS